MAQLAAVITGKSNQMGLEPSSASTKADMDLMLEYSFDDNLNGNSETVFQGLKASALMEP